MQNPHCLLCLFQQMFSISCCLWYQRDKQVLVRSPDLFWFCRKDAQKFNPRRAGNLFLLLQQFPFCHFASKLQISVLYLLAAWFFFRLSCNIFTYSQKFDVVSSHILPFVEAMVWSHVYSQDTFPAAWMNQYNECALCNTISRVQSIQEKKKTNFFIPRHPNFTL